MNINIAETFKKYKARIKPVENEMIIIIVVILVAFISFGLGRLSKIRENKTPITITEDNTYLNTYQQAGVSASQTEKIYVASKSGTKYHYPWCPGALNIKEENKIWFATKEEAEKSGYSPAANCKGL